MVKLLYFKVIVFAYNYKDMYYFKYSVKRCHYGNYKLFTIEKKSSKNLR